MVIKALRLVAISGLVSLGLSSSLAHAQIVVEAKGRGAEVQYALPAGTSPTTPIYFYYVSKGRDTKTVQMMLRAPQGAVGTLEVAKLNGAAATQAAASLSNSYVMQLRDAAGKRNALRITAAAARAASGSFASAQAECTPEQLAEYAELIRNVPELAGITPEQYCAGVGPGPNPSPTPGTTPSDGATDSVLGLLQKNACGKAKDKYLVRMKVDLSGVDPVLLQNGTSLGASFSEVAYRGGKAASIKPFSDGMFAPNALLLMSSIRYGSEGIFQTKWKNGALGTNRVVPIVAYAGYRNLTLTRSVVTSLLSEGGKATFDITDGNTAYSVCFKMQRTRQSKNGYPIAAE
jgi:hypothetical protein